MKTIHNHTNEGKLFTDTLPVVPPNLFHRHTRFLNTEVIPQHRSTSPSSLHISARLLSSLILFFLSTGHSCLPLAFVFQSVIWKVFTQHLLEARHCVAGAGSRALTTFFFLTVPIFTSVPQFHTREDTGRWRAKTDFSLEGEGRQELEWALANALWEREREARQRTLRRLYILSVRVSDFSFPFFLKFIFIDFRERETLICHSTHICIPWFILACGLTGDRTHHRGVPGWRSSKLSGPARAVLPLSRDLVEIPPLPQAETASPEDCVPVRSEAFWQACHYHRHFPRVMHGRRGVRWGRRALWVTLLWLA